LDFWEGPEASSKFLPVIGHMPTTYGLDNVISKKKLERKEGLEREYEIVK
jgi:hypothetical protein